MYTTIFSSIAIYFFSPCLIELWLYLVAKIKRWYQFEEKEHEEFIYNIEQSNYIPIIYSSGYNMRICGLEWWYPFDTLRYENVFNLLLDKGVIS